MRTCPELLPLSSLYGAPIATREPSEDNETEYPDSSDNASPSMSLLFDQEFPHKSYILTCPVLLPLPSLYGAPIATREPSEDNETAYPHLSDSASPSIPQLYP